MNRLDEVADSPRSRTSVAGRPVGRATMSERVAELRVPAVSLAVWKSDVADAEPQPMTATPSGVGRRSAEK